MDRFILLVTIIGFSIVILAILFNRNRNKQDSVHKIRKVALITVFSVVLIFSYLSGYRFNALAAAKANMNIDKNCILMTESHRNWVDIYYYFNRDKDMYYSVIVDHKGILYRGGTNIWLYNNEKDDLKTIGQVSYISNKGENIATMVIESNTDNVSYIEAGPEDHRIRLDISNGKQILFEFDNLNNINTLNPIAYGKDGEALYYYGYPKGSNILKDGDYKWHKIVT